MPEPTTPPPLDDRGETRLPSLLTDAIQYEMSKWPSVPTFARVKAARLTVATLAILDLPARDRDTARAALTGYATEMDAWNLDASRTEARRVRYYRDTHYPTQEAPDAR